MRRAWVLPLLLAPALLGLRRPDPNHSAADREALATIQRQIDTGRIFEKAISDRTTRLQVERQLYGETPVARNLESELASLKMRRDLTYGKAAHLVAELYDIDPRPSVGVSVFPGFEGKWVVWTFVVADLQPLTARDSSGNPRRREIRSNSTAVSSPDGAVVISPGTFENSIPMIAAHIFHESRHFQQYTTRGLGDHMSQSQREADAFSATRQNADIFGLNQFEKDFLDRMIIQYRSAADTPEVADHSPMLDSSSAFVFSKEDLARIRRQSAALRELVASENRARFEEESAANEFVADQLRKEQARDAYDELFRWAKIACEVADWDRGIDWGSWGDNFEQVDPGLQRPAVVGPAPCELHLVTMLLDARIRGRKGLPLDYVLGLVEQSRQRAGNQNPPPARAVATPLNPSRAVAAPANPGGPPTDPMPSTDMDLSVPPGAGDYNRCIHSRCIRWR